MADVRAISASQREESGNSIIGALHGSGKKPAIVLASIAAAANDEEDEIKEYEGDGLVNPFVLDDKSLYEEIFDSIDVESACHKTWIIDGFEPVLVDESEFAKFHTEDCYIVLYINDASEGRVEISIHYWIGKNSSPDRFGTAAYRAVELNMYLGGRCSIYREEEGEESELFKSHYSGVIEVLPGSSENKLNVRTTPRGPNRQKRTYLYRVFPSSTGQMIMQIVKPHFSSLNSCFCFILDDGESNRLYQWNGLFSKNTDRQYVKTLIHSIDTQEKRGKSELYELLEGDNDGIKEFWTLLEGHKPLPKEDDEKVPKYSQLFKFDEEDAENFKEPIESVEIIGSWNNYESQKLTFNNQTKSYELEINLKEGEYKYKYLVQTKSETIAYYESEANDFDSLKIPLNLQFKLYETKINDSGDISTKQIPLENNKLERKLLDSDYSYIIDCFSELYIWIGSFCSPQIKAFTKKKAISIYKNNYNRPSFAPIFGCYETSELISFKSKFSSWHIDIHENEHRNREFKFQVDEFIPKNKLQNREANTDKYKESIVGYFADTDEIDIEEQLDEKTIRNKDEWMDNIIIENLQFIYLDINGKFIVKKKLKNILFNENCYFIILKYKEKNQPRFNPSKIIIYFWIGLSCKNSDSNVAKFNIQILNKMKEKIPDDFIDFIKINQGKETKYFMKLFDYFLIIKQGNQHSYLKYFDDASLYIINNANSYKENLPFSRNLIQEISSKKESLLSTFCYLLLTKNHNFCWIGSNTNKKDKLIAQKAFKKIQKTQLQQASSSPLLFINEQSSKTENSENSNLFFSYFEKDDTTVIPNMGKFVKETKNARIYAITSQTGFYSIFEISDFSQFDLLKYSNAILLLHYQSGIFLWKGKFSIETLRNISLNIALDWIFIAFDTEDHKSFISYERQGEESLEFRFFFPGWQGEYFPKYAHSIDNQTNEKLQSKQQIFNFEVNAIHEDTQLEKQRQLLEKVTSSENYSRIEENEVKPVPFKVNFDKELLKAGIKSDEIIQKEFDEKFEKLKSNCSNDDYFFSFYDSDDKISKVILYGSWNEWKPLEMNSFDDNKRFYNILSLNPGRYYYFYQIQPKSGEKYNSIDQNQNILQSKLNINQNEENVSILRIYSINSNKPKLDITECLKFFGKNVSNSNSSVSNDFIQSLFDNHNKLEDNLNDIIEENKKFDENFNQDLLKWEEELLALENHLNSTLSSRDDDDKKFIEEEKNSYDLWLEQSVIDAKQFDDELAKIIEENEKLDAEENRLKDEENLAREEEMKLAAKEEQQRKDEEERLAKEAEEKRLEEERLAKEEQERKDEEQRSAKELEEKQLEEERLAKEAEEVARKAKEEEERLVKEAEEKRLEEERLAKEAEEKRLEEERSAKELEEKQLEEKLAKEAEEAARKAKEEEERLVKEAEEKRLEEERLAKEEQERKDEEERLAKEVEEKRIEEERRAKETEEKRLEKEKLAEEAARLAKETEEKRLEQERKAEKEKLAKEKQERKAEEERLVKEAEARSAKEELLRKEAAESEEQQRSVENATTSFKKTKRLSETEVFPEDLKQEDKEKWEAIQQDSRRKYEQLLQSQNAPKNIRSNVSSPTTEIRTRSIPTSRSEPVTSNNYTDPPKTPSNKNTSEPETQRSVQENNTKTTNEVRNTFTPRTVSIIFLAATVIFGFVFFSWRG